LRILGVVLVKNIVLGLGNMGSLRSIQSEVKKEIQFSNWLKIFDYYNGEFFEEGFVLLEPDLDYFMYHRWLTFFRGYYLLFKNIFSNHTNSLESSESINKNIRIRARIDDWKRIYRSSTFLEEGYVEEIDYFTYYNWIIGKMRVHKEISWFYYLRYPIYIISVDDILCEISHFKIILSGS
jgi:hypothetical protein